MNRLLSILLLIALAFGCGACSFLSDDAIGEAYSSDILATVDGTPIRSFHIDGKTAIALEDLRDYGFDVSYDEAARTLSVRTLEAPDEPHAPEVPRGTPGEVIGRIYKTDVTVRVNGVKIPAYTINGFLCAAIEDLGALTDPYNQEWGYSDYNMRYRWDEETRTITLECFRFTVSDWTALYHEMEAMMNQPEIELYTEGAAEDAPYFGAPYEPHGGVYAGINADGNGKADGTGRVFENSFAVLSNYIEFDQRQDFFFKPGSQILPVSDCLSLVPWNTSDVTQVFEDEVYIRRMLDYMASFKKPMIIRFGGEMNIGTLGDSPSAYVKAFRKVADIVHEYPGFAVMWSPNDLGSLDRPFAYYYPGDEYVDWIGVSSFMKRDFMGNPNTTREDSVYFMTGSFAWHTNSLKPIVRFMQENGIEKPLAISEGAVTSSLTYAQDDLSAWGEPRLRAMYWYVPMRYPQVKMITYFNNTYEGEEMRYALNGHPNYISIVADALQNGPYLLSYSQEPRYSFVQARGQSLPAAAVPLYTYAYLPEELTVSVDYQLDGASVGIQTQIPYRQVLDLSAYADGAHTLTLVIQGEHTAHTQTYTISKQGDSVQIQ